MKQHRDVHQGGKPLHQPGGGARPSSHSRPSHSRPSGGAGDVGRAEKPPAPTLTTEQVERDHAASPTYQLTLGSPV